MKSFSFLLLVLAFFGATSVAHAIAFNWTTPDETWGSTVTGGALIYNSSDNAEYKAESLVALAKDSTPYSGFTNVVDTEDATAWNFNTKAYNNTLVSESGKHTDAGTYFIVLFDKDSNYAIAKFSAAEAKDSWSSEPSEVTSFTYFKPSFSGSLVPEPSLLALLALGVAGLALKRRA